jgi:hypothetical protein
MKLRASILPLAVLPLLASAQLFEVEKARGGGTWNGCDTALVVEFTDEFTDYLQYRFLPNITPGGLLVTGLVWSVYDGAEFNQVFSDTLQWTFPGPGDHLVCLTAIALDLQTLQPCSTTTCRLVSILQDPTCAALDIDFTIGAIAGSSITFVAEASFPYGPLQHQWSIAGQPHAGPTVEMEFTTSGPHRVCLTSTGPPPVGCTASVCKWLYQGPVPVPCEELFTPGFLLLESQESRLVGVLDTSNTFGMPYTVDWDFGDGSPVVQGPWAVHGYGPGQYQVCSTVRSYGPLLADTCVYTLCKPVFFGMVGVGEAQQAVQRAWPNPTWGHITVETMAPWWHEAVVYDALGRRVAEVPRPPGARFHMDLGALPAGMYHLRTEPWALPLRIVRVDR